MESNPYFVYILKCSDGTLYTGITNDIEKRIKKHNEDKGAKYTRGRGPVICKYLEKVADKGEALKREFEIKKMDKKEKVKLFNLQGLKSPRQ